MELRVAERLMLLNLLPQEGDIVTLRVVREGQTAIGLTEEELEALDVHTPVAVSCTDCDYAEADAYPKVPKSCPECGKDVNKEPAPGRLAWKTEADVPTDIKVGRQVERLIGEKLEALSEEKKLSVAQMDLYDKFVDPPAGGEDKVVPIKEKK